jgi:hypothetical protein
MTNIVDLYGLTPIARMIGEDEEETAQLKKLHLDARKYLQGFTWCNAITSEYFGAGVADIVGIFLFEISNASSEIDSLLWIIVGDIPPAYLVLDQIKTPVAALKRYIELRREWTEAIKHGRSLKGLMPVNAGPTLENARDLEVRLSFLEQEILPKLT